jgi:multidrug efflux pump subunit AcrA (membrane-fusion protein)
MLCTLPLSRALLQCWMQCVGLRALHRAPLLVLGLTLLLGCGSNSTPSAAPQEPSPVRSVETVPPVASLDPVAGAPSDALLFAAEVESTSFTELRFAVPGRVDLVRVEEGAPVRAGTVLASLDRADREARLAETQRRLSDSRSARKGVGRPSEARKVPSYLRAEMEQRLRDAERDRKNEAPTRRALDRAAMLEGQEGMTRVLQNRAYQHGKRARRTGTNVEQRTEDERLAVALITDLEQRELRLKRELEECDLVSPIDGVVVKIGTESGESAQTRGGDADFVLIDSSDFVVRFAVPERLGKILGPGEEAWLEFEPGGRTGTGSVLAVDTLSYETGRAGEGLVTDVLVRPEQSLLQSLSIGQQAVVALRR